jgi:hypothetical protein
MAPKNKRDDEQDTPKTVLRESPISKKARLRKQEPEDVTAAKKRKTMSVRLKAIEKGFNGEMRINPGVEFDMDVPLDAEGLPMLPTWAVFPEDWRAPEEVKLPPGMQPRSGPKTGVQGVASKGGLKADL